VLCFDCYCYYLLWLAALIAIGLFQVFVNSVTSGSDIVSLIVVSGSDIVSDIVSLIVVSGSLIVSGSFTVTSGSLIVSIPL
jgi:hypothetical protein